MDQDRGDTPRFIFSAQYQLLLVGDQDSAAAEGLQPAEAVLAIDEHNQDPARTGREGTVNEDLVTRADAHAG
ncbi:hypothetical protein SAMN05428985_1158 [Nocardioides sp. YR527]|nr:hypothetical protein [Nocardioides sp. YR527]SDL33647.1 hypothetical protein SAMN05428985_1158 [Nocardioides sp. YR527]